MVRQTLGQKSQSPPASPTDEPETPPDNSDGQPPETPDPEKDDAGHGKGEPAAAEPGDDPDVPFHKHPRWQQMLARERELSGQVAELGKRADVVNELRELTSGEQGFNNMLTLVRTFSQDPASSVPMLETLLADAKKRGGLVITSPDLQQKLEEGQIDEAGAIEVERVRRQQALQQERQSAAEQQRQAQAAQAAQAGITSALNAWEANLRKTDPDYGAIEEEVTDRALRMAAANPPANADAAIKLAAEAYSTVKARWKARMPARPPVRHLPGTSSSANSRPAPKTLREVVQNTLRRG